MSRGSAITTGKLLLGVALAGLHLALPLAAQDAGESSSRPLPPDYRVHADGSVTQRVCFNWSCSFRQRIHFSAAEMSEVAAQMSLCPEEGLHNQLQRMRIGIWQMELLAQKHQPLLANDEAINSTDQDRPGRMDCVDNASNTTSYLAVLHDLGLLRGWSIAEPQVRDLFSMQVHWTATVVDAQGTKSWAVDSWFRGNGNLPFVLPVEDWAGGRIAWEPPLSELNPYPLYTEQLCSAPIAPPRRS